MLSAIRSADEPTPLWSFPLPGDSTVELFVKDESRRPTGSLKYGLARSLLADALRRGRIERAAPTWIVTGVGTGATSRAIGRHLRTHGHTTRLAVVDPQNSAYFPGWASDCPDYATSVAAMRHLSDITGRSAGPSTGACLVGALHLIARMREQGRTGTVVVVQGDSGRPYADTYYDDGWIDAKGWDLTEPAAALAHFAATGRWDLPRSA
ncbi:cysteine synthase [Nocardia sp. GAS34]|uniref:hypothetical protein n=1 Tax=unclassified Nocardia TaxID=2637762 RepID=UPI003D26031B